MSDLPIARVTSGFPFSSTGVDLFGPMMVRQGRKCIKRYGCIFTCLKIRAVHIELVYSLSIDPVMLAFTRFVNRCEYPKEIFSDRGTNLVGSEYELRSMTQSLPVIGERDEVKLQGVVCTFNLHLC